MTTIDELPSTEHIARAKALRRASVAIATHAEPGPTRADVLEDLALLIADLEGMPARECRSCGLPFGVGRDELAFYRSRGRSTPRSCHALTKQAPIGNRRPDYLIHAAAGDLLCEIKDFEPSDEDRAELDAIAAGRTNAVGSARSPTIRLTLAARL